jgi:predicted RNA-binding protein YlxR (DUF448 family)
VRSDRSALQRIVVREGVVVADPSASLPGRGAWVHPTVQCVEASVKRKAFGRAFRSSVTVDTVQLLAAIASTHTGGIPTGSHEEQAD